MSQENGETLERVAEELDSLRIAADDPSSAPEPASSPVSNGETCVTASWGIVFSACGRVQDNFGGTH